MLLRWIDRNPPIHVVLAFDWQPPSIGKVLRVNIRFYSKNGKKIGLLDDQSFCLATEADALDIMGTCQYNDTHAIIIDRSSFKDEFFDLSTNIAGGILQKFVTYGMQMAIVGNFDDGSGPLQAFIVECNRGQHLFFTPSRGEAEDKLCPKA